MSKSPFILPSADQIGKAAYSRWERRGWTHGSDREDWLAAERDLTFELNYRTLWRRELSFDAPTDLGPLRPLRCRFCEQAAPKSGFGSSMLPIVPIIGGASIARRDICEDCFGLFQEHLEPEYRYFWQLIPELLADETRRPRVPLAAFKALAWIALGVLPDDELEFFPDALEWANNPDHDEDASLFSRLVCLAYSTVIPSGTCWISLDQRRNDDCLIPSLLFFVACNGTIVQFPVPLGVADQEADGDELRLLQRSWSSEGALELGRCRLIETVPRFVAEGREPRSTFLG